MLDRLRIQAYATSRPMASLTPNLERRPSTFEFRQSAE
jgi:hypothetical protein